VCVAELLEHPKEFDVIILLTSPLPICLGSLVQGRDGTYVSFICCGSANKLGFLLGFRL
jgi:hypothetical protein